MDVVITSWAPYIYFFKLGNSFAVELILRHEKNQTWQIKLILKDKKTERKKL